MHAGNRPLTSTGAAVPGRIGVALLTAFVLVIGLTTAAATPPATAASDGRNYSGSDLWLRYVPVSDAELLEEYRRAARTVVVENADSHPVHRHTTNLRMAPASSEKLVATSLQAARDELDRGLDGLLDTDVPVTQKPGRVVPEGAVVVGTPDTSGVVRQNVSEADLSSLGDEGYLLRSVSRAGKRFTVIAGNTEVAALYGTFAYLRRIQTQKPITGLNISSAPKVENRHLNNWEETRLYAGNNSAGTGGLHGEDGTIFNFDATGESADRNLPLILDRYITTARAMASVGLNGIEINLVNADNAYLTRQYIAQEAALADALRPYGIKISLAINYTAPTDDRFAPDTLTEDQLDPTSADFRGWWRRRAQQIQQSIPDFMGFTVKANSEGQPGPQDFGYDHGDGANGIAAAVAPLGMTVYWRTFVYNADVDDDRLKRAYLEFGPIDEEPQPDGTQGRFRENVFLQTKNGPLDFQAREPINPMLGRMENTNQALELQITQEYTGQNKMLCFLAPMWEEAFKTDTHATDENGAPLPPGKRRVGNIVDGSAQGHSDTAVVGVANLGNADNLTGHHFSQANLYAFGIQAWDWTSDSRAIAEDWVRMTWSNNDQVVHTIVQMMMGSWEALVSYQTPLGIAHQFTADVHYGPGPAEWVQQDDWSPVYYNQADSAGLGYDRSRRGSNFVGQYFPALADEYGHLETVPENLMMWFHHVPWDHRMHNGRTFWKELVYRYQIGVQYVTWMRETWDSLQPHIDARRFREVKAKLATHESDAADWRDTNVDYWQEFSRRDIPTDDAPLSAAITVAGKQHAGFDLSQDSYAIPVSAGASPRITDVATADPQAEVEIVSQAEGLPGRAVVKVTSEGFFGPLVKNYVFRMLPDTTLDSLTVNGQPLDSFDPAVEHYHAVLPPDTTAIADVAATASDPSAEVRVDQADSPTGLARVTVDNDGSSSTHTVDLDSRLTGSDDFESSRLGSQWHLLRPDGDSWRLTDGSLAITSQRGDLQGDINTARNVAVQEVNGDWTVESKLTFSRPLARDNEQGGLVALADDDNYVKLAWEMADQDAEINRMRMVLQREQGGTPAISQVTGAQAQRIVGRAGELWLRLAKTGTTYKAYYSRDGEVYRFMGSTHLNADPAGAGLVAFNRAGTSSDLDVAFDHFLIESQGDRIFAR
jgi:alpha-glucuronidase